MKIYEVSSLVAVDGILTYEVEEKSPGMFESADGRKFAASMRGTAWFMDRQSAVHQALWILEGQRLEVGNRIAELNTRLCKLNEAMYKLSTKEIA